MRSIFISFFILLVSFFPVLAEATTPTLTFSSGFGAGALTVEGGGFGGYGGSNLDNFNCTGGGAWCGGGGSPVSTTVTAAQSYVYYYYQTPSPATGEFVGLYVQAPGVTALSKTADTAGIQINGQTNINFTFNDNPEWFASTSKNVGVILTLGKHYMAGSPAVACNIELLSVFTPTSASATSYSLPLSAFTVTQNCGDTTINSVAAALAASPISEINFQGVYGATALTAGGLTTGTNTSVLLGAVYPTTLVLTGGITFSGTSPVPTTVASAPAHSIAFSVFTSATADIAGTNLCPYWSQATQCSLTSIGGVETVKYSALNFEGIQLYDALNNGAPKVLTNLNVTTATMVHFDVWTPDVTSLGFALIAFTPPATAATSQFTVNTTLTTGTWNSVDIPLSSFTGVDLANINQLMFVGATPSSGGTIYVQNIYFYSSLNVGWNLVGNSISTPLTVATTFNNSANVSTVWKWETSGPTLSGITYPVWAFYTPLQADGGKAYAASKGYDFLATINPGEGFWVNAKSSFTPALPTGSAISLAASNLSTGWNLVATGDSLTPTTFTTNIGNITTLWAWDNVNSNWYFYAPSLAANSTLASYISNKNYENFGMLALNNGLGFWVNYAGTNIPVTPPLSSNYSTIKWQDNFSQDSSGTPNPSYWAMITGNGTEYGNTGWGNNEAEYYLPSNAFVSNGVLNIHGHSDLNVNGYSCANAQTRCLFSSAKVTSLNTLDLSQPGFLEIRATVPTGQGSWPALWILPGTTPGSNFPPSQSQLISQPPWPSGGEIDLVEYMWAYSTAIQTSMHLPVSANGTYSDAYEFVRTYPATVASTSHLYQLLWTNTAIQYAIDNIIIMTCEKATQACNPTDSSSPASFPVGAIWPYGNSFTQYYLIMNLAIGGGGGITNNNNALIPTSYDQTMQVFSVRYLTP